MKSLKSNILVVLSSATLVIPFMTTPVHAQSQPGGGAIPPGTQFCDDGWGNFIVPCVGGNTINTVENQTVENYSSDTTNFTGPSNIANQVVESQVVESQENTNNTANGGQGGNASNTNTNTANGGQGGNASNTNTNAATGGNSTSTNSNNVTSTNSNTSNSTSSNSNNNGGNSQLVNINDTPEATVAPLPQNGVPGQIGDVIIPLPSIRGGVFTTRDNDIFINGSDRSTTGVSVGFQIPLGTGQVVAAAEQIVARRESAARFQLIQEATWMLQQGVLSETAHPEHWVALYGSSY